MAPLSILPGRLRLESSILKGRRDLCHALSTALNSQEGVRAASASYRTGRLLVTFDEARLTRKQLTAAVEELLACGAAECSGGQPCPKIEKTLAHSMTGHVGRHLLVDLLTHAILPRPLDLLLPPAMAALKR